MTIDKNLRRIFFSYTTKIALTIAVFFWSSAFVAIRIGLKGYTPGGLALMRSLISSFLIIFIYWFLPNKAQFTRKDLFLLLLFGALGYGSYNIFLNYAEISVSAGIASFIVSQSPLIAMLCAVVFLGEKFSIYTFIGILISILGVGLITLSENHAIQLNSGLFFIFFAAIASALYSVLQKPFLKKYAALDVAIFIIWGGTLILLVFLPELGKSIKTAPLSATLAVIYLGIFPTTLAYIAWSYALAAIPASKCVSFLYFMPIITTFLGWVTLGEIPAVLSLVGGLIALIGVWLANHAK